MAELALLWDRQGLLRLHQEKLDSRQTCELVRVFNCYKAVDRDRQIGDRRGRNAVEGVLRGPSSNLPAGQDLCDLSIDLDRQRLHVSISDGRDFYHQLWVTKARAITNTLGPGLPVSLVDDTDAYKLFLLESSKRKYSRERHGDHLEQFASHGQPGSDIVWACFNSVLQGDHGGVEIATDAHSQLLRSFDLLKEDVHLVANRPCFDSCSVEGLVIDDFFCVSIDDKEVPQQETKAYVAYKKAQEAYAAYDLLGSPEKDIVAESAGKAIGAYINGSSSATSTGVCTVGAPASKRLALSALTLHSCALPYTTASLHRCIVGAWVSMLLYRRPMMNLLNHSFSLVDSCQDLQEDALVPLPRTVAQELVLCAVLAPLLLSDIAVPFDETLYATDASESRGAVCSAYAGEDIVRMLTKVCKTKGAYTRLHNCQTAKNHQSLAEFDDREEVDSSHQPGCVGRPLAFSFEFMEIFAGSSRISEALSNLSVVVGLDISLSEEYDLSKVHVLAWIYHLIESGRLLAVAVEPPCTTFSIMRRPALRSRSRPLGFDPKEAKTQLGNHLFLTAFQILKKAAAHSIAGLLERPFSALSKFLVAYQRALHWPGAVEVRIDSCQYGSIHQKSFAFLSVNVDMAPIVRRCPGTCNHVPIAGVYTKASAIYTAELATALAWALRHSIEVIKARKDSEDSLPVAGLEN